MQATDFTESEIGRFWRCVAKCDGCWEWQGSYSNRRYGRFSYRTRWVLAHRVSYTLSNGAIPAGLEVMHHCDNPRCVRPDHLSAATHAENMRDMARKGRTKIRPPMLKGEDHPRAKLTREAVLTIRRAAAEGGDMNSLALTFRVNPKAIRDVLVGRTWSHVA